MIRRLFASLLGLAGKCGTCNGTGKVGDDECNGCAGQGWY